MCYEPAYFIRIILKCWENSVWTWLPRLGTSIRNRTISWLINVRWIWFWTLLVLLGQTGVFEMLNAIRFFPPWGRNGGKSAMYGNQQKRTRRLCAVQCCVSLNVGHDIILAFACRTNRSVKMNVIALLTQHSPVHSFLDRLQTMPIYPQISPMVEKQNGGCYT